MKVIKVIVLVTFASEVVCGSRKQNDTVNREVGDSVTLGCKFGGKATKTMLLPHAHNI